MAMKSWCDRFIEAFGEEIVEKKKVESEAIESQWLGQGNTFEVKLFIRVKGGVRFGERVLPSGLGQSGSHRAAG
jgi:hypothetical protein